MTTTTIAQRLRAAAEAERLSDHVRVSRDGIVYWRNLSKEDWDENEEELSPLFMVKKDEHGWWMAPGLVSVRGHVVSVVCNRTRSACVRAGLVAIAEDIERGAR